MIPRSGHPATQNSRFFGSLAWIDYTTLTGQRAVFKLDWRHSEWTDHGLAKLQRTRRKVVDQSAKVSPKQIEEGTKVAARTVLGGKNRMPMLEQYQVAKKQHPGMVLVFPMGDFYELFEEDAELAAKVLGLTLTSRDKTVAMAGFPHHALEAHLKKLLKAGHRMAVCEQVVEAGSVQPEVTRVVTS